MFLLFQLLISRHLLAEAYLKVKDRYFIEIIGLVLLLKKESLLKILLEEEIMKIL
jgi:hypothetical protein